MASIQKLLLDKIDSLDRKMDDVRTKDIPGIHTAMALQKKEIESQRKELEERTGKRATFITAVGGAITVAVSVGSALAVMLLK